MFIGCCFGIEGIIHVQGCLRISWLTCKRKLNYSSCGVSFCIMNMEKPLRGAVVNVLLN